MGKRQDIEFIRIISAFAIVWYHSLVAGGEVSYSGLVVFLILSIYLGGRNGQATAQGVWRRTERLMVPWAFWFLFYAIVNVLLKQPVVPMDEGVVAGTLIGSSRQLWYMPFIFMCLLALDVLKGHASKLAICLGAGLLSLLMLAMTPLWRPFSMALGAPVAQWLHALAAVCLGAFLLFRESIAEKYSLLVLLAAVILAALMINFPGVGLAYVLGIYFCGLIVFGKLGEHMPFDLTPISQAMLGVFFLHTFLLQAIWHWRPVSDAWLPIGAFVLSFAIVKAMQASFPKLAKYWS